MTLLYYVSSNIYLKQTFSLLFGLEKLVLFFSESREVFFLGSLFYPYIPIKCNYLDKITHLNNWTFLLQYFPTWWQYRNKLSLCSTICLLETKWLLQASWIVKHLCVNTQKQLIIHVCLTGLRDNFWSKDIIMFIYSCHHLHCFIWRCALSNYWFNSLLHFILELV